MRRTENHGEEEEEEGSGDGGAEKEEKRRKACGFEGFGEKIVALKFANECISWEHCLVKFPSKLIPLPPMN